ncbi:MAG TPA: DUF4124 domain-containing protein [Burkholderiales bacterium]|nr:DUF4124 domain-containing protein [Burkholderiales bacterium]
MRAKVSLTGLLAAAAIAVPVAAHAGIYKWVDEKGGVTYGNTPPPTAKKVTQLDEDNGRVSTVPGPSPEQLARIRELELEARIQRLERELYEQRLRDAMAAQSYPGYADYYGPGYFGYGGYAAGYFPAYGFPFARRFVRPVRVHPPFVRPMPVRVVGHRR